MSSNIYGQHVSTQETPQSEPIFGRSDMARNNAGGYTFVVDDWTRLQRFLILGSEGGTYYVGERKLTRDNAADGLRVVSEIVAVSKAGRAPKNDPALFALALALKLGDDKTRKAAAEALPEVARIGTHLLHLANYVQALGGWGRATRRAFSRWYTEKTSAAAAYQMVKYQQRDGWAHRDVLRLAHVKPPSEAHDRLFRWSVKGVAAIRGERGEEIPLVWAFEQAKHAAPGVLRSLIETYKLPWEALPSETLKNPEVWQTLLETGALGLTAMIRNLGRLTSLGLLTGGSEATKTVCAKLCDAEALKKARVHPLAVLLALTTYRAGCGVKGSLSWQPVSQICDALDEAFYSAFGAVEPTGKRLMLALDVSGSMGMNTIAGTHLSCCTASAALALVTMRVESGYAIFGFTTASISRLSVSPRQRHGL